MLQTLIWTFLSLRKVTERTKSWNVSFCLRNQTKERNSEVVVAEKQICEKKKKLFSFNTCDTLKS